MLDFGFYNMDCMEGMVQFPDNYFDLAIVDPPYGVGSFHDHKTTSRPYNRKWVIKWNNNTPDEKYWIELKRVAKNLIIWGINYYPKESVNPGRIIWDKGNNSGIGSDCEIAEQFKDNRVLKWHYQYTGFCRKDKDPKIHPCQKPIYLYRKILKEYGQVGWKILDTHVGSGSSLIACEREGFQYVGFEIDPDYYKAAKERIERERLQLTLALQ